MRTQKVLALLSAATLASALGPGVARGQGSSQQDDTRARECPETAALRQEVHALRSRLRVLEGAGDPLMTEGEASRRSPQVTGTVDSLDGKVVWLRDRYGNLHRVVVDEDTQGRQDGRAISSKSLAPGMSVRARMEVRDGEQVAKEVEVLPPPAR